MELGSVGQLLSAAASAVAAGFAWWNTSNGRKASNANVLLTVLRDYRSEEMRQALRGIREFQAAWTPPEAFAVEFVQRIKQRTDNGDDLDSWRRLVSSFFNAVRALSENRLLDQRLLAGTIGRPAFEFAIGTLGPIDKEYAKQMGGGRDNTPYFSKLVEKHLPG
jgi:hypothetical protein